MMLSLMPFSPRKRRISPIQASSHPFEQQSHLLLLVSFFAFSLLRICCDRLLQLQIDWGRHVEFSSMHLPRISLPWLPSTLHPVSIWLATKVPYASWLLKFTLAVSRWVFWPLLILVSLDTLAITVVGIFLSRRMPRHPPSTSYARSLEQPSGICGQVECAEAPRVLVQLPMYNERAVYERAINSACILRWPSDRLLIQVLDDSTEEDISAGMRAVVSKWQQRGVNIMYSHRQDNTGYKAGNLREGLRDPRAASCEFVAILDADFEPQPDWLELSVSPLQADPGLALVQTRWTFSNAHDSLLTRLQEAELKWHFLAEQLSSSWLLGCFGFNGTAGVWRLEAIRQAGDWRDDTTVEDMDMALCAAMSGWRFLLLPHVTCRSELPASLSAYRKQQQRWTSGPASLLRLRLWSLLTSPSCDWKVKAYMLLVYISLRRGARHLLFISPLLLLPMHILSPSPALLQLLASVFAACTLYCACVFTFSGMYGALLVPAYLAFQLWMSVLRVKSFASGLLGLSGSKKWEVTEKRGRREGADETAAEGGELANSSALHAPSDTDAPSETASDGGVIKRCLITKGGMESRSATRRPSTLLPGAGVPRPKDLRHHPQCPTAVLRTICSP